MTNRHPSPAQPSQLLLVLLPLVFGLLAGCSAPAHRAVEYREMAWQAALRGDAAQSGAFARKAISLDPDTQWNHVAYGWCLFDLGLYPEALVQWRKCFQRDPEACRINACLALACHQTGREKEAVDHYARQVKIEPAFGRWETLLEATAHWQPDEKKVLHAVYRKWRAAGRRH